jgi:hypothetical protein
MQNPTEYVNQRLPRFAQEQNHLAAHRWLLTPDGPPSHESIHMEQLVASECSIFGDLRQSRNNSNIATVASNHGILNLENENEDAIVWDDMEAEVDHVETIFCPLVDRLLSRAFFKLGITKVDDFGSFFKTTAGGHALDATAGSAFAESNIATHPNSIMITPTMISCEYRTSLVNLFDEKEFIYNTTTHQYDYNCGFWTRNIQHRSTAVYGQTTKYINFGGTADLCFIHPDQHASHLAGFEGMKNYNATINTNSNVPCVKIRLYDVFQFVFVSMMNAPIVATARHYHFKPVLLMKSVLFRRNKHENIFEIQSISRGAVSSIHMVGFLRKSKDGKQSQFLALTGANNSVASIF